MSYRESSLPRSRLTAFPQLTTTDFEEACTDLVERFRLHGCKQNDWQSVEMKSQWEMIYLRVIKTLSSVGSIADELQHDGDDELGEDNDDEALGTSQDPHALIHYDILLSPVYRVPVLYINVSDLRHRYPPTMATLYQHVISAPFKAQTESGGVMGGITISDHPVTGRPVFFIHPCQTAEVMQASVGKTDVTPEEYLLIWIGALGKCVGLDVPLALMQRGRQETDDAHGNT